MKNTPDYYTTAKKIASELKRNGHQEEADQIDSSINFGSTSTEILMALSFFLKRISSDDSIEFETRRSAELLRSEIEVVLK